MANSVNKKNDKKRDEVTCIQLPKDLRNRLANEGKKDETFADIVTKLLDRPCEESPKEGESESE